jgi:hypothetical protein
MEVKAMLTMEQLGSHNPFKPGTSAPITNIFGVASSIRCASGFDGKTGVPNDLRRTIEEYLYNKLNAHKYTT